MPHIPLSSSSSPLRLPGRTCVVSLLALLLLCAWCLFVTALANPATPTWSSNCESPFTNCADVEGYEDWSKESGKITFRVNARFADYKNGVTLWYVGDAFSDRIGRLQQELSVNVVHVNPRGGSYSTPSLSCAREELDDYCQPTKKCAEKVAQSRPHLFSVEQAAKDLDWAIRTLNQKDKPVIVFGEGYGSAVAMLYMKMRANTTVSAILMNPVQPLLYDHFHNMWSGYDQAMQRLMHACDGDTACSAKLGATEGAWARLVNVLGAASAGHLPCQQELGWGTGADFGRAVSNQLATMLLPPSGVFAPTDPGLTSLIPAFLYRLQRCNTKDVDALKSLRRHTVDARVDKCPEDIPLRTLWLANEFTTANAHSQGAPSAKSLLNEARSSRSVIPLESTFNAFVEFYNTVPRYERKAEESPIAYTRSKLLVIYADLDPLLPLSQANSLALTYADGNTHHRHPVNRAVHLPGSNSLYQCLKKNVEQFKANSQWNTEATCYNTVTVADNGIDFTGKESSLYFGTKDAWEFTVPYPAEPPEGRLQPSAATSKGWRVFKRILKGLLWLLVIAVVAGLAYVAYTRWSFSRSHVSDDFFDNLHR